MIIKIQRYSVTPTHTKGLLFVDGRFICHTLEDTVRCQKIHEQTAIDAGIYEVKQRKQITPLTQRYRDRFNWFDYHFQIMNVPNFNWVYIHVGNTELDTEGCLLVGLEAHQEVIAKSVPAFERLYKMMHHTSESITLTIE